jgi:hypothetical protein
MIAFGTLSALVAAIGVTRTISTVVRDGYGRVPTQRA